MRNFIVSLLLLVAFSVSSYVNADASQHELKNYEKLRDALKGLKLEETLIVLDNDDTISTMPCKNEDDCQYLGGAAWFDWQNDLIKENDPERVAANFGELLQISALLFNVSDMQYTDEELPNILAGLTKKGVRLLVETARGTDNVNATVRQLRGLEVQGDKYKSFLDMVQVNGLVFDGAYSLPSPLQACNVAGFRPIVYQQGVMYLAGQNKGVMLKCMLKMYEQQSTVTMPIKNIVFVDDTLKNVTNVYKAFKGNEKYNVKAYHYTALSHHKNALTEGKNKDALQARANDRWGAIKAVLGDALLKPAVPVN